MAKNDSDIPAVHPVVAKLLAAGDGTPPKALSGYVGQATRDGYILVYPSLRTLERSYEISTADIIHSEPIPESIKPFGATMIWLRPEAVVGFRNVNTGNSSQSAPPQPGGPLLSDGRIGRLMIQSPVLNPSAAPPEQMLTNGWQAFHCTCTECSVCMSHCDNSCSS